MKELIDAAAKGFAADAAKINKLSTALQTIVYARGFKLQYGRYPYAYEMPTGHTMSDNQTFEMWADQVATMTLRDCGIPLLKVTGA